VLDDRVARPARLPGSGVRYVELSLQFRRRDQAGIEARIKDICATRVRYGYRRVHVLLKREGWDVNVKRTYRIYRDLGLQLRNKRPKQRVKTKLRDDRQEAVGLNDVWASSRASARLALRAEPASMP
jgi:putative transposase